MTISIFILCAPADRIYQNELEAHLQVSAGTSGLSWTSLRNVPPGANQKQWLRAAIDSAHLILLGVSKALHQSCSDDLELVRRVIQLSGRPVVPLLLRHVDRSETWYGRLQPLPRSERPVRSWPDRDSAWAEIVRDLLSRVQGLHDSRKSLPQTTGAGFPSTSAEQTLFNWLHISDLHLGHGDDTHRWDQRLVLTRLLDDARTLVAGGTVLSPSAILVTGDVAFSGNVARRPPILDEYEAAEHWLVELRKATAAPAVPILVVPGNHDIQRRADSEVAAATSLVQSLREGTQSLDAAIQSPASRQLLSQRLANYCGFIRQLGSQVDASAYLEADQALTELGVWACRMATADQMLSVRIIGLNSTILAADDKDQGHLRIGMRQLSQTLAASPNPREIVMVLTHHPCSEHWLADEAQVRSVIESGADVHLCGHVHRAEALQQRRAGGHAFITLQAGTAHGERGEPASHGYSFGAIVRTNEELRLRYWPRRFVVQHQEFRSDSSLLAEGCAFEEFSLRSPRIKDRL